VTGIGRLAVTLEKATDKSSSSSDHHSSRTPVRFKFDTPYTETACGNIGYRKAPTGLNGLLQPAKA